MKITVNEDKVRVELAMPAGRVQHADPMKLRPLEVSVLCHWLSGLGAPEIAAAVGSSQQYVNNLLSALRTKLGVKNHLQLAYLAYDRGYVVIEEA